MADPYSGELVLRRHGDSPRLEVLKADPRIRIAGEMHDEMLRSRDPEWGTYDGELLRVLGRNQTVVYRVVGYDADRHQYLAEWPD